MRRTRCGRMIGVTLLVLGLALPLCSSAVTAASDLETQRATALARVNQWRAAIGVPPIARHPALDKAAQAHAEYHIKNPGSVHDESSGHPGFTGASFADRAQAAGYPSSSINEDMGGSGDILASLNWFIGTINHRLPILDPRYIHIGFGIAAGVEVVDFGAPDWSETSATTWEQWPPDGASGIALSFAGESPDALGAKYPVGTPITLKYLGTGAVSFTGATVTAGGKATETIAATGKGWLTHNTDLVATTGPMQPGTDYRITITGTANGQPFTKSWGFHTKAPGEAENVVSGASTPGATSAMTAPSAPAATATVGAAGATGATASDSHALPVFPPAPAAPSGGYKMPKGMTAATATVGGVWGVSDGAVAAGRVSRSWLFGPDALTLRTEPYVEGTGGKRTVVYFDKARMEIARDGKSVTNGLLVTEMVSGQMQIGDTDFRTVQAAAIPIAGDEANNTECPTYATLTALASYGANAKDRRATDRTGKPVTATLDASGTVGDDATHARGVMAARYEPTLGHNIPDVFASWLGSLPDKWETLVGMPITEPYWTQTRVGGTLRPVLMQAFERRVLTYTPDNAAAWQVEMGNVGAHYLRWQDEQSALVG